VATGKTESEAGVRILLLVGILFVVSADAVADVEVLSHNCISASIKFNVPISGSLDSHDCINWDGDYLDVYEFTATADSVVAVSLTATTAPAFVQFVAPNDIVFSPVGPLRLEMSGPWAVVVKATAPFAELDYTVRLDCLEGPCQSVLALHSGRFSVSLTARDHRSGRAADGLAIRGNELFGYFSIPGLTNNQGNPEVFVKILDGRPLNGRFWVFHGSLTDLEYTIEILDNVTGVTRTYSKAGGSTCGGSDTSAFEDPAQPPNATGGLIWGQVLNQEGICIADAVVEIVGGPVAGRQTIQKGPCDVWGDWVTIVAGYEFHDLPIGVTLKLRATKEGYRPQERETFTGNGPWPPVNFVLSRE
jgi:hypothetical protein